MWTVSRPRLGWCGAAVVALALAASATVAQQMRQFPSSPHRAESVPLRTIPATCGLPAENVLRLEEGFRAVLDQWSTGGGGAERLDAKWQDAVDAAAGFHVTDGTVHRLPASPSGRVIVPAIGCHERAEQDVLRIVATRAPEVVPTLFAFYLEVYARQVTPPPSRRWLASRARDRLLWLTRLQKQLLPGGIEARRRRGRMLLMLADTMQSAPFYTEILEARDLLDEVIDLAPESIAARYMASTLAERSGDYETALRELSRLVRRLPDDREVALRLAVNRVRTGDTRAGRSGLQTVARGPGPAWVRVLAYQEWVSLAASSRGGGEMKVLEEARSVFPQDRQLSLQEAAALLRSGQWSAAERVAGAAETGDPDEPSPRSLYDLPRRGELDAERAQFDAEVRAGLPRLRLLLSTTSGGAAVR